MPHWGDELRNVRTAAVLFKQLDGDRTSIHGKFTEKSRGLTGIS
jgi:hypothetical protein